MINKNELDNFSGLDHFYLHACFVFLCRHGIRNTADELTVYQTPDETVGVHTAQNQHEKRSNVHSAFSFVVKLCVK